MKILLDIKILWGILFKTVMRGVLLLWNLSKSFPELFLKRSLFRGKGAVFYYQ